MVETTTKYGLFKSIKGNRVVDEAHVLKLREAIEHRNLLNKFPILVNENMEVIDGQHRLAAAVSLNIPISYEIEKGLSLADVIQLNTSSKSWTVENYVDSFIELGKKDYQTLKDFKYQYELGWTTAAYLLQGEGRVANESYVQSLKLGNFVANRGGIGTAAARLLHALRRYSAVNTGSSRSLAGAVLELQRIEEFSEDRLLGKFQTHGLTLQKRQNMRYYLLELEEIYNFQARDNVTLYAGQA